MDVWLTNQTIMENTNNVKAFTNTSSYSKAEGKNAHETFYAPAKAESFTNIPMYYTREFKSHFSNPRKRTQGRKRSQNLGRPV